MSRQRFDILFLSLLDQDIITSLQFVTSWLSCGSPRRSAHALVAIAEQLTPGTAENSLVDSDLVIHSSFRAKKECVGSMLSLILATTPRNAVEAVAKHGPTYDPRTRRRLR